MDCYLSAEPLFRACIGTAFAGLFILFRSITDTLFLSPCYLKNHISSPFSVGSVVLSTRLE
jgi:hypothetical protein